MAMTCRARPCSPPPGRSQWRPARGRARSLSIEMDLAYHRHLECRGVTSDISRRDCCRPRPSRKSDGRPPDGALESDRSTPPTGGGAQHGQGASVRRHGRRRCRKPEGGSHGLHIGGRQSGRPRTSPTCRLGPRASVGTIPGSESFSGSAAGAPAFIRGFRG